MSNLARAKAEGPDLRDDPDGALVAWVELKEALFRRLERQIVADRLKSGFHVKGLADVDGFLQFSLSVQNRRKPRMGLTLEIRLKRSCACDGSSTAAATGPRASQRWGNGLRRP